MNCFTSSISILSSLLLLMTSVQSETIINNAANESSTCLVNSENVCTDGVGGVGGISVGNGSGGSDNKKRELLSLLGKCRDIGFDPWNLSCDTCTKLYENHATKKYFENLEPSCYDCCQEYKASGANKFLTKPYESALIVQTVIHNDGGHSKSATQNNEVDEFLNDDYTKLLEAKTSKRILRIKKLYDPYSSQRSTMRFSVFGPRQTTTVYFFDTIVPEFAKYAAQQVKQQQQSRKKDKNFEFSLANSGNNMIDEDKLTDMAKEIISIDDGWKRDDIRDMIQTLLPDEKKK